jgi:hypothetical protein
LDTQHLKNSTIFFYIINSFPTMKPSSKYQCCGITCAIIGVIVLALGISFFAIIEVLLESGSKKEASLVPDTYE